MKKFILSLTALASLFTLVSCKTNSETQEPAPTPTPSDTHIHEYGDATYTYSNDMLKVTGVVKCKTCEKEITETTDVEAYEVIKSTCTTNGLMNYVSNGFTNSHFTVQTKEVVINASGHNLIHHNAQDSTCTENGWKEYDTCLNCDYTTYEIIDKLNHNYSTTYTWNDDNTKVTATRTCANNVAETVTETVDVTSQTLVEATCLENGSKKLYASFSKSYFETQSKEVEIEPLGHDMVTVEGTPATCTTTGLSDKIHCSRCDYVEQEATELSITEHKHIWEGVVETTICGETGCTGTEKCEYCGKVFTEPTYYTNDSEHNYIYAEGVEVNCINYYGITEGYLCENCGHIQSGCEEITAEDLSFEDLHISLEIETNDRVEPTCTENGYIYISGNCSACAEAYGDGFVYYEEILEALGHNYEGEETKLATSFTELAESGNEVCTTCGNKKITDTLDLNWKEYKFDSENTPISTTYENYSTRALSYFIHINANVLGQFGLKFYDRTSRNNSNTIAVNSTTYTNETSLSDGSLGKVVVNLTNGTKKEYNLISEDIDNGLLIYGVDINDVENIEVTFVCTLLTTNVQHELVYNFKVYNEEIVSEKKE